MSGILGTLTALSALAGGNSGPVQIGSITLTGSAVPSEYTRGGGLQVHIHKAPGGARIINLMGGDPARRAFAGKFIGQNAVAQLRALEALRDAGKPVTWQIVGYSEQVVVVGVKGRVHSAGYVVDYTVEAEVLPPSVAATTALGASALSSLIGSEAASAVTSVTSGISSAAAYVASSVAQVQSIVGQVQPVAALVGLGGPLAKAGDLLTAASAYSQATQGIAGLPSGIANMATQLQSAAVGLTSTISSAGSSVLGISNAASNVAAAAASATGSIPQNNVATDATSLAAATAQAGVLASAVQAGGQVNALSSTLAQAAGTAQPAPLVHA